MIQLLDARLMCLPRVVALLGIGVGSAIAASDTDPPCALSKSLDLSSSEALNTSFTRSLKAECNSSNVGRSTFVNCHLGSTRVSFTFDSKDGREIFLSALVMGPDADFLHAQSVYQVARQMLSVQGPIRANGGLSIAGSDLFDPEKHPKGVRPDDTRDCPIVLSKSKGYVMFHYMNFSGLIQSRRQ
jgi:hypothetical protein